ncbi:MAG: adenylate cyclase [Kordiimonas sp.]|mgnify:CR=1 FL=1|nr:adenylate cyclase [Kordiimonas sp.]
MPDSVEIERKFLVYADRLPAAQKKHFIRQGYMARENGTSVRIRQKNDRYILTIKANRSKASRYEFEYDVPSSDGELMFDVACSAPAIEKVRLLIQDGEYLWEVDVFAGQNDGLYVAEVELQEENAVVRLPDWVGPEVTGDPRFANAALYSHPFEDWNVTYDELLVQFQSADNDD